MPKLSYSLQYLYKYIVCSSVLLSACAKHQKNSPKTLRIGISNNIKNLDLRYSSDKNVWKLTQLFAEPLIDFDTNQEPVFRVAASYKHSNFKTFEFKIKRGLKFHDGRAVTSSDVLYSFKNASSVKSVLKSHLDNVKKYETPSPHLFKVQLIKASPNFLTDAVKNLIIFPEHIADTKIFQKKPIGTGPYKIEAFTDSKIILAKAQKNLFFNKIEVKTVLNPQLRILALLKNELDVLPESVETTDLLNIERNNLATVYKTTGESIHYLGLNLKKEPFKSIRNRQHLKKILHESTYILGKFKTLYSKQTHLSLDSNFTQKPAVESHLAPASAFAQPLKFTISTSSQKEPLLLLVLIKEVLLQNSIKTKIVSREFGSFYTSLKDGDYDSFLFSFNANKDIDYLYSLFHSSQFAPIGRNRFFYKNSTVDRLLEKGRYESDLNKRNQIYTQVLSILNSEIPMIPLWTKQKATVFAKPIKGYKSQHGNWRDFINTYKVVNEL